MNIVSLKLSRKQCDQRIYPVSFIDTAGESRAFGEEENAM